LNAVIALKTMARAGTKERKSAPREETFVVETVAALKALADPVRLRIVMLTEDEPRTVKELAAALELPQTGLYYHVKILLKAKIIRVASRRMVSGIEERTYQAVATNWPTPPERVGALTKAGVLKALLDMVEAEIDLAVRDQPDTPAGDPSGPVPFLLFTRLALDRADATRVQKQLEEIVKRYGQEPRRPSLTKPEYHALFEVHRAPGNAPLYDGAKKRARGKRHAV
jgi:DNA-binding transcriptional ArsR family regulator